MDAWPSYADLAERYDLVWSARFEAVARQIAALVPARAGERVLDVGTGTGIVARILAGRSPGTGLMVACDRSAEMVVRARERAAGALVLVTDAAALPFADHSFDLVTASFVLSHIQDYPTALAEMLRVLKASGRLAVSSWAPPSDPYTTAWDESLAGAVDKLEAKRAVAEVVPWEEHFSKEGALEAALTHAGFSAAASTAIDVEGGFTADQFVEDRELSPEGLWARHVLGAEGWARVRAAGRKQLQTRYGSSIRNQRRAFIVTARKP